MPKSILVLGPLALLVALFAACSEGDTNVVTSAQETPGIQVSGHGEVQAQPDTAFIDMGVQVTEKNVADARESAAKAADAVISSLKQNGVDEKDIKTINFSIQPQYVYDKNGTEPRITGYIVTNTVEAKIRKLDSLSKVIDDATLAGGDNARFQSVRFDIEDNQKLLEQAREAAMKDAKAKADQLAKLSGVSLGKPLSISETQSSTPPPQLAEAFAAPATGRTATPIQPGTGSVTVDVTVRWSIGN
jgi:uncharacterized protein YggE